MTQIPYQPMHKPRKHVSQARMLEILAKHAKPQVEIAAQSPKAKSEPPLLTWLKPVTCADGSVTLDSACGSYRIEKSVYSGVRTYRALTNSPEFRFQLGTKASADEAKAVCEAEARKRAAREPVPATGCGGGAGEEGG